jgi:predicted DCC family thiol-disulfide oxidoreductase YuxK
MKRLYVLFDQECALCQGCRQWLMRQRAYIELYFIPLQSPEIARRFPGLKEWDQLDLREKLVVVSDDGAVYQGQYAWIMCLYALRDYREWAQRLAHPTLVPFARRVCEVVSRNRLAISRFLKEPVEELGKKLNALQPASCPAGERCNT